MNKKFRLEIQRAINGVWYPKVGDGKIELSSIQYDRLFKLVETTAQKIDATLSRAVRKKRN